MRLLLSTILASIATVAFADSALEVLNYEIDALKYPEFAEAMLLYGYTWEAYEIITEDSYKLTTFRIKDKIGHHIKPDESLQPVVLMHGLSCDAVSWVQPYWGERAENHPLPLQLFDRGFDVYMAANRGTKYCQGHETLQIDDPAYWDWSWAEMGLYDDVANVKFIKERTGKKVSYVGVS